MNKKIFTLGAVALAASVTTQANAASPVLTPQPIFNEVSGHVPAIQTPADANTQTGKYTQLILGQLTATSIYIEDSTIPNGPAVSNFDNQIGPGDTIYDTNIAANLSQYYAGGTYTGVVGNSVLLENPVQDANAQVTSLQPVPALNDALKEGYGTTWVLLDQYNLYGTVNGLNAGHPFDSGQQDIYLSTSGVVGDVNNIKVLQIDIDYSEVFPADLVITGTVNKAFLDGASAFVQNFFKFTTGGTVNDPTGISFWQALQDPANKIVQRWDTNVDAGVILPSQLVAFAADGTPLGNTGYPTTPTDAAYFIRQTQLDGSKGYTLVHQAPEPSSIALMGLGLAGMGIRFGRKNKK